MSTPASNPTPGPLPCPLVVEINGELPTEFACFSAFAPLVTQRRSSPDPRPADIATLSAPVSAAAATSADAHAALQIKKVLPVDGAKIDLFCRLMTQEGWSTQADRMGAEPLYARDRLAIGYGSACAELSRLALELFRLYEVQQGWRAAPASPKAGATLSLLRCHS